MYIRFQNGNQVSLSLNGSPLSGTIRQIYKHLQHVELPFRDWDNPFYLDVSPSVMARRLEKFGQDVGVPIDQRLCENNDQSYLNHLHKTYEKNYNGDPKWLDFHEHIHMCEEHSSHRPKVLELDFREKAGMLEKKFDLNWLEDASTSVNQGDVFCAWSELGKTPYWYWKNQEPNDIVRMCELAKPWLKLRPKITIALEDFDLMADKDSLRFNDWWKHYQQEWCQHWGLKSWTLQNMCSVSVIGRVDDVDFLKSLLTDRVSPIGVVLK